MNNNHFDTVIILGGGRNNVDGSLTPLSKARLDTGVEVIKGKLADSAVVMGKFYKSYTPDKGLFNTEGALLRKDYLTQNGIDTNKIETIFDECMDTFYEALASRKLAREKGWKKILLDTSVNHMDRSLLIFRRIYGKDFEITPVENPCPDNLNPQLEIVLYGLAEKFLSSLPDEVPYPNSWDIWFESNRRIYYDKVLETLDDFHREGTISRDAYSSIRTETK